MVRYFEFTELGGPEKLALRDGQSSRPAPGEAKLLVQAAGLNRSELLYLKGTYGEMPNLPSRIGFEAVGIVEEVGSSEDSGLIGKQVGTIGGFSQKRHGVMGTEAIVPTSSLVLQPPELSPLQGAAIWISYLTAWGGLIETTKVKADDTVVITAASSSVGLAGIQVAREVGAIVVAVTRMPDKVQALLDQGANHAFVIDEALTERILRVTGGEGNRVTFDAVGGPLMEQLVEAAAPQATVLLYGGLSGKPTVYPLLKGLSKGLSIRGFSMNEIRSRADVSSRGQRYIQERLADHRFFPKIARVFPFERLPDAYHYLESNEQIGKVVVSVNV